MQPERLEKLKTVLSSMGFVKPMIIILDQDEHATNPGAADTLPAVTSEVADTQQYLNPVIVGRTLEDIPADDIEGDEYAQWTPEQLAILEEASGNMKNMT